jgi:hypothetical protein
MSQRESGYERKALDQYETPPWVTLALVPHLPEITGAVWEPACGGNKMVAALRAGFFDGIENLSDSVVHLRDAIGVWPAACWRFAHKIWIAHGGRMHF